MGGLYLVDFQDIPRDNLRRVDFDNVSIPDQNCLQGQCFLQFLHDGASLELLNKPDAGVEDEECANDAKVDPVP